MMIANVDIFAYEVVVPVDKYDSGKHLHTVYDKKYWDVPSLEEKDYTYGSAEYDIISMYMKRYLNGRISKEIDPSVKDGDLTVRYLLTMEMSEVVALCEFLKRSNCRTVTINRLYAMRYFDGSKVDRSPVFPIGEVE